VSPRHGDMDHDYASRLLTHLVWSKNGSDRCAEVPTAGNASASAMGDQRCRRRCDAGGTARTHAGTAVCSARGRWAMRVDADVRRVRRGRDMEWVRKREEEEEAEGDMDRPTWEWGECEWSGRRLAFKRESHVGAHYPALLVYRGLINCEQSINCN
jgi:hypothetical protein